MSKLILGFSHDNSDWISRVMSWSMCGKPSHVVLVSPDGRQFIEATGTKTPNGVQHPAPIADFLATPGAELRWIDHPNPQGAWDAALTQVGKPYDWVWIIGCVIRSRRWDDQKRWACAELITWSMCEAGDHQLDGDSWHIHPGDLYTMSRPLQDQLEIKLEAQPTS